ETEVPTGDDRFASAMLGENLRLAPPRLCVHDEGIAHALKLRVAPGEKVFIPRAKREIVDFLAVRVEVEKLGRKLRVVDVLVPALADHENAGCRSHAVIFGKDQAVRLGR